MKSEISPQDHHEQKVEDTKAQPTYTDKALGVDMVVEWFEKRREFMSCKCSSTVAAESTSNWEVLSTYTVTHENGGELEWKECVAKATQIGEDQTVVRCTECFAVEATWAGSWLRRFPNKIQLRTENDAQHRVRLLRGIVREDANWSEVARIVASFAGQFMFESRQGLFPLAVDDHRPVVVIFNNHPYADTSMNRDDETAIFRQWLVQKEINELAYATWDDGYSFAMILDAGSDQADVVDDAYRQVVHQYRWGSVKANTSPAGSADRSGKIAVEA